MATITAAECGVVDAPKFLDLISFSEGTKDYGTIVTGADGKPEEFTDFRQHPFVGRPAKLIVAPGARFPNGLYSTASGRYQLLLRYWLGYKTQLHLPDFGPISQDKIALQQMREKGVLDHLNDGSIEAAISAHLVPTELEAQIEEDATIWASLPGNGYGQGGRSMTALLEWWESH